MIKVKELKNSFLISDESLLALEALMNKTMPLPKNQNKESLRRLKSHNPKFFNMNVSITIYPPMDAKANNNLVAKIDLSMSLTKGRSLAFMRQYPKIISVQTTKACSLPLNELAMSFNI